MWDWVNGGIKKVEEKVIIDPGNEFISGKLMDYIKETGVSLGKWFVEVLPDIIGYGTVVAGSMVILGSMVGMGGMIKPLGYLSGGIILSLCILTTV